MNTSFILLPFLFICYFLLSIFMFSFICIIFYFQLINFIHYFIFVFIYSVDLILFCLFWFCAFKCVWSVYTENNTEST